MDTLPLPPRPDLDQYRKRAKSLATAANSRDPDAMRRWAADWLHVLARLLGVEVTPFVQHSVDRAVEDLRKEADLRVEKAHREGTSPTPTAEAPTRRR